MSPMSHRNATLPHPTIARSPQTGSELCFHYSVTPEMLQEFSFFRFQCQNSNWTRTSGPRICNPRIKTKVKTRTRLCIPSIKTKPNQPTNTNNQKPTKKPTPKKTTKNQKPQELKNTLQPLFKFFFLNNSYESALWSMQALILQALNNNVNAIFEIWFCQNSQLHVVTSEKLLKTQGKFNLNDKISFYIK